MIAEECGGSALRSRLGRCPKGGAMGKLPTPLDLEHFSVYKGANTSILFRMIRSKSVSRPALQSLQHIYLPKTCISPTKNLPGHLDLERGLLRITSWLF